MPGRSFSRGNKRAAKLTGEEVMQIRESYFNERGCTQGLLAIRYQVSVNTIASIVRGHSWQGIAGDDGRLEERVPPPLDPRPKPPGAMEASMVRVNRLLDSGMPLGPLTKAPSLYNDPPPEVPGEEPTGIGMARLNREAENLQPQVGNELDKLEKGD